MVLNYFSNFFHFKIIFYKFAMFFFSLLAHNYILLNIFITFFLLSFLTFLITIAFNIILGLINIVNIRCLYF